MPMDHSGHFVMILFITSLSIPICRICAFIFFLTKSAFVVVWYILNPYLFLMLFLAVKNNPFIFCLIVPTCNYCQFKLMSSLFSVYVLAVKWLILQFSEQLSKNSFLQSFSASVIFKMFSLQIAMSISFCLPKYCVY